MKDETVFSFNYRLSLIPKINVFQNRSTPITFKTSIQIMIYSNRLIAFITKTDEAKVKLKNLFQKYNAHFTF
jgi:ArsR family metal-binding transcriptional regulator